MSQQIALAQQKIDIATVKTAYIFLEAECYHAWVS
jgi:hypothetical protein